MKTSPIYFHFLLKIEAFGGRQVTYGKPSEVYTRVSYNVIKVRTVRYLAFNKYIQMPITSIFSPFQAMKSSNFLILSVQKTVDTELSCFLDHAAYQLARESSYKVLAAD